MRTTAALVAQGYFDSWVKLICPYCKTQNWFCLGDLSDITQTDIEAGQCLSCNKKFWLSSDIRDDFISNYEEEESSEEDLINEAFCQKGRIMEK